MLSAAQARRKEGIDVVSGITETQGRVKTKALVDGLESHKLRPHFEQNLPLAPPRTILLFFQKDAADREGCSGYPILMTWACRLVRADQGKHRRRSDEADRTLRTGYVLYRLPSGDREQADGGSGIRYRARRQQAKAAGSYATFPSVT
jgi:hypothetical protein